MSLEVDIEKNLPGFTLWVRFTAEDEILALLGASGSGKSMTLRCIAGIEHPDRGRIVVDGVVFYDSVRKICLTPQQRKVGYLFQNYALFPHMTTRENILAGMGRMEKAQRAAQVEALIARFHLSGLEDRFPAQLSGGQQQRVALARIVGSQPRILLLDEPFSALDTWLRWQLEQELSVALEAFSGTTVFVSHNRKEAYRLCGRVGLMCEGTLEGLEEKWGLFRAPQTVEACLLTGCKNIASAVPQADGSVFAPEWGIHLCAKAAAGAQTGHVGVRAHSFYPVQTPGEVNSFSAEVCRVIEDTASMILLIRPLAAPDAGRTALIRCELSKEAWKQWETRMTGLCVACEDVLLLQ